MGEARRRGTFKQRKAAAIKRDTIARLFKDGCRQIDKKLVLPPAGPQTIIDQIKAKRRALKCRLAELIAKNEGGKK